MDTDFETAKEIEIITSRLVIVEQQVRILFEKLHATDEKTQIESAA